MNPEQRLILQQSLALGLETLLYRSPRTFQVARLLLLGVTNNREIARELRISPARVAQLRNRVHRHMRHFRQHYPGVSFQIR
jgi:DNA-binding CsgD family transcriptional regulator